jgi:hypothetical protein
LKGTHDQQDRSCVFGIRVTYVVAESTAGVVVNLRNTNGNLGIDLESSADSSHAAIMQYKKRSMLSNRMTNKIVYSLRAASRERRHEHRLIGTIVGEALLGGWVGVTIANT